MSVATTYRCGPWESLDDPFDSLTTPKCLQDTYTLLLRSTLIYERETCQGSEDTTCARTPAALEENCQDDARKCGSMSGRAATQREDLIPVLATGKDHSEASRRPPIKPYTVTDTTFSSL